MYNKLFTRILDSSIWLEPISTRIVWITLLAAMDEDGFAHFSAIENLAARARVSIEETNQALKCLLNPDINSGDPEFEGRRIERVPGGFIILNAAKYRGALNRVIEREQIRIRVAKHRKNKSLRKRPLHTVTPPLQTVTPAYASVSVSESIKRGMQGGERRIPATEVQAAEWASMSGVPPTFAIEIYNQCEGRSWVDGSGQQITSWTHYIKKRHSQSLREEKKSANNQRNSQKPNPRNVGTYETGTDYAALVKRKMEQRMAERVANQPPPQIEGTGI